jgi:hypothetical protein
MKCLTATWTFTFTPTATLNPTDTILLKFPATKFTFARIGITSSAGPVVVIFNTITNEIYYYIRLTATFPSGVPATFTLINIRNSNGFSVYGTPDLSGVVVT